VVSELEAVEVAPRPCWIAGGAEQGEQVLTVRHPYDGTEVADVAVPAAAQVERAVAAATDAQPVAAALRASVLTSAAELVAARTEEIAETLTAENGTPLVAAHAEVADAVAAFRCAAELAGHADDVRPVGAGMVVRRRWPRGPVLAVTPSVTPLLLVACQVAAAIAAGTPIVVRPSSATPLTALLLGEILADTDLPADACSILPGADATALVADPRLPVVSFCGSPEVAGLVTDAVPRKHVRCVTGGSTAVVCRDADLADVAERIATAGTTVRVVVPADVAEVFVPLLADTASAVRVGNPHDPAVQVGPMISEAAAQRTLKWLARGQLLAGGTGDGACVAPAVVTDLTGDIGSGPVAVVSVVDDLAAAFGQAGRFGLATGVFTRDMLTAFDAAGGIDVPDVVIGALPPADRVPALLDRFTRAQVTVLTTG
jgi:acyl-CoA reductase-like NAD-dependent aldehyde dehydrogenase